MKTLPLLFVLTAALAATACDRRETDGDSSLPPAEGTATTNPANTTPGAVTPPSGPDTPVADPGMAPDDMPPAGPIDPPPAMPAQPQSGDEGQPGQPAQPEPVTQ